MGMLPITTSASELFSRINIDDFERPWTSKIRGFIDFCDLRLQRTLQEWTATKWLEIDWQFANRNCYRSSRVSWALAQISCNHSQTATNVRYNHTTKTRDTQACTSKPVRFVGQTRVFSKFRHMSLQFFGHPLHVDSRPIWQCSFY